MTTARRTILIIALAMLYARNAGARLHDAVKTAKTAKALARSSQAAKAVKQKRGNSAATATIRSSEAAAGGGPFPRAFPSLTSCAQKPDSTPFRVSGPSLSAVTQPQAAGGSTWCFSVSTADPKPANTPCGNAASLERIQLWASHANRSAISSISLKTKNGEGALYGSWVNKGTREEPFRDELVFSKLGWSATHIDSVQPRICLTLRESATLESICKGPEGRCVVGLYSIGEKGIKCCPVYVVQVA